jgi:hypothetical protein
MGNKKKRKRKERKGGKGAREAKRKEPGSNTFILQKEGKGGRAQGKKPSAKSPDPILSFCKKRKERKGGTE